MKKREAGRRHEASKSDPFCTSSVSLFAVRLTYIEPLPPQHTTRFNDASFSFVASGRRRRYHRITRRQAPRSSCILSGTFDVVFLSDFHELFSLPISRLLSLPFTFGSNNMPPSPKNRFGIERVLSPGRQTGAQVASASALSIGGSLAL